MKRHPFPFISFPLPIGPDEFVVLYKEANLPLVWKIFYGSDGEVIGFDWESPYRTIQKTITEFENEHAQGKTNN